MVEGGGLKKDLTNKKTKNKLLKPNDGKANKNVLNLVPL